MSDLDVEPPFTPAPKSKAEAIAGIGCLTLLGVKLLASAALVVLGILWLWRHL